MVILRDEKQPESEPENDKRSRSDSDEETKLPYTKAAKVVVTVDNEVQETELITIWNGDSDTTR